LIHHLMREAIFCRCCNQELSGSPTQQPFVGLNSSVFNYNSRIGACQRCGFIGLYGLSDTLVQSFYSENESEYFGSEEFDYANPTNIKKYEKYWDIINFYLPDSKGKTVIDIGCGGGGFLHLGLKKCPDATLIGVDFNAKMLTSKFKGISFYQEITGVESAKSAAIVTMFHVLEHICSPIDFLKKAVALLTDSGKLVLEVPDSERYSDFGSATYWFSIREHVNHFSSQSLETLMRLAGLKTLALVRYDGSAPDCDYPALLLVAEKISGTTKKKAETRPAQVQELNRQITKRVLALETLIESSSNRIVCWGLSNPAMLILGTIKQHYLEKLKIFDKNKAGSRLRNISVERPRPPLDSNEDLIIFTSVYSSKIYENSKNLGWDDDRISFFDV
jgi:SAM-dependent methyltransferase